MSVQFPLEMAVVLELKNLQDPTKKIRYWEKGRDQRKLPLKSPQYY